jgi:hypothetical protein
MGRLQDYIHFQSSFLSGKIIVIGIVNKLSLKLKGEFLPSPQSLKKNDFQHRFLFFINPVVTGLIIKLYS